MFLALSSSLLGWLLQWIASVTPAGNADQSNDDENYRPKSPQMGGQYSQVDHENNHTYKYKCERPEQLAIISAVLAHCSLLL